MKRMKLVLLAVLVMTFALFSQEKLILSTTTSTYETGLLDYMLKPFEKKNNCTVHCLSLGTGKAIEVAKNGDADVILVHARADEDKFVAEGFGVNRKDVRYNDFIIMGPKEDPAKISGLKDAKEAFMKQNNLLFQEEMSQVLIKKRNSFGKILEFLLLVLIILGMLKQDKEWQLA